MEALRSALYEIIEGAEPVTVRQAFYLATVAGLVDKTEEGYGRVQRQLALMRKHRELPFHWIADNTRWMRKPDSWDSIEDLLRDARTSYRRALWNDQNAYVEIWLEKDALAGVVVEVTDEWDVPLMVTRGYPSLTFLYSAAQTIADIDKPAFIYYFGDLDPSGVDIPRKVEAGLREYAPDAEISFRIVAVTRKQVEDLDLPTRPTKKSDSRARSFRGDSVELDAMSPNYLRGLVQGCIEHHVDDAALSLTRTVEANERRILTEIMETYG